jgi:ribosomal protein L35
MKTNKSYTKRLRLTPKGKILGRAPGKNHFNAKAPRHKQLARRRAVPFNMSNKARAHFLPGQF